MGKYAVLAIFAHLLILSILPFTTWPEMLLYPWLTAQGFIQYQEIIHPYSFGLIAVLTALGNIVGFTPLMVKLATYTIVVLCDLLVYRAALLFGTSRSALATLLLYILWQISFEGNGLWFDLALIPIAVLGFYGLVQWLRKQRARWLVLTSATLLASILVKQTGVWFVFVAAVTLVFYKHYRAAGRLLLLVLLGLLLFSLAGYLIWGAEFLYWTIWFPVVDQKQTAGFVLLPSLHEIALVGLLLLPVSIALLVGERGKRRIFLLWIVAGSLSAFPRWALFHLQPALPFLALFVGLGLTRTPKYMFLSMVFPAVYIVFMIQGSAGSGDRFVTKEVLTTTEILKREVGNADLFILGAPQLLYVLSFYTPPRPWADLFPWYYQVREGRLETQALRSLETNPPGFVLRAPITEDRLEYRFRPQKIEQWVDKNYQDYKETPSGILWKKRE